MKQVSRQRIHYLNRVLNGLCGPCGKPRGNSPYMNTCIECAEKRRERQRKKKGFRKWSAGGRGRPPLTTRFQPEQ